MQRSKTVQNRLYRLAGVVLIASSVIGISAAVLNLYNLHRVPNDFMRSCEIWNDSRNISKETWSRASSAIKIKYETTLLVSELVSVAPAAAFCVAVVVYRLLRRKT
jgi:hypothetical protein